MELNLPFIARISTENTCGIFEPISCAIIREICPPTALP